MNNKLKLRGIFTANENGFIRPEAAKPFGNA
jgi:hypothetical protein